ncbi:hypothetical protein [Phaffia rhodozyma]|uniref:Uncharacterized protein n=1 Tax=Phaffia rhodozyma TaxID=264483 RepID=A0A0F7SVH1_PHARH|nr:hypothetical protein [Phaffia rhodozyma]
MYAWMYVFSREEGLALALSLCKNPLRAVRLSFLLEIGRASEGGEGGVRTRLYGVCGGRARGKLYQRQSRENSRQVSNFAAQIFIKHEFLFSGSRKSNAPRHFRIYFRADGVVDGFFQIADGR